MQDDPVSTSPTNPKIAIVDGMVFVQKMAKNKKGTFNTVKDLAQSFNDRLTTLTAGFSEVILVFDTYKTDSLKEKLERDADKEKLLYSTRLKIVQKSNITVFIT